MNSFPINDLIHQQGTCICLSWWWHLPPQTTVIFNLLLLSCTFIVTLKSIPLSVKVSTIDGLFVNIILKVLAVRFTSMINSVRFSDLRTYLYHLYDSIFIHGKCLGPKAHLRKVWAVCLHRRRNWFLFLFLWGVIGGTWKRKAQGLPWGPLNMRNPTMPGSQL